MYVTGCFAMETVYCANEYVLPINVVAVHLAYVSSQTENAGRCCCLVTSACYIHPQYDSNNII